jgi:hypothetical protein
LETNPTLLPLINTQPTATSSAVVHSSIVQAASSKLNLVSKLSSELTANQGIVPASWLPYLEAIKFLCEGIVLFAGPELKAIITVILAAIAAAEGND